MTKEKQPSTKIFINKTMNVEQLYSDMMEYNVSPSVFEFDEKPANTHIDMTPQYQDNSLSGKLMRQLGFQTPYKSQEELQKEAELEQQRQEEELERQRQAWCKEFKNNPIVLNLNCVWGDMNKQQLQAIKKILDKDEDCTYIYAGSKDRTEHLSIDDVCAHVVKSKIKGNNLECKIQFDYSPAGMALYNNYRNGFLPKLNLNTILSYNEKDPTRQDMKFNCLEFI